MSQEVTQNVSAKVVVLLTKNNVAVTGLTYSGVTAQYRKEGGVAFSSKTLSGSNFAEVGLGVYTIQFTTAELDTAGVFVVVVTGATIDQSTTLVNVLPVTEATTSVTVNTCTITGHVFELTGVPMVGVAVSATILGHPSIEQNEIVLADTTVSVTTDSNGMFFLPLIRLADVEIAIPAANYRRRIVVPNQSTADLFKDIA
jgi:hypothetical protein